MTSLQPTHYWNYLLSLDNLKFLYEITRDWALKIAIIFDASIYFSAYDCLLDY